MVPQMSGKWKCLNCNLLLQRESSQTSCFSKSTQNCKDIRMNSMILSKSCRYLSSTANQITPLPPVLMKQCVDWLELFMAWSEPLCLFPIYSARVLQVAIRRPGTIRWIWQKVHWIRNADCCTYKLTLYHPHFCLNKASSKDSYSNIFLLNK